MKKLFVLITLVAILISSLVGCADTSGKHDVTDNNSTAADGSTTTEVTTENPYDKNGYLKDKIPENAALVKKEINMICGGGGDENLWTTDGPEIAVIDNAVYLRNLYVQERLDCTLNISYESVGWEQHVDFYNKVTTSINTNAKTYDIVVAYSPTMPKLVQGGFTKQLNALDYLDFTQPWWPSSINDELMIADKLYMASGDACLGVFDAAYVMFFNRDIATNYQLGDIYDTVISGNYTLDFLIQIVSKLEQNSEVMAIEYSGDAYVSAFLSSLDIRITENNSKGIPFMTFGTEETINKTDALTKLFSSPSIAQTGTCKTDFNSGKLFGYIVDMKLSRSAFKDTTVQWGCIPCPKYNAAQENYKVWMSTGFGLFVIPRDVDNPNDSALFLESFASQSYRTATPAYYYNAMKCRYAPDETTAEVFDIIRSGLDFQFGAIYAQQFTPCTFNVWRSGVQNNTENWSTIYSRNSIAWETQLSDMVTVIRNLEP